MFAARRGQFDGERRRRTELASSDGLLDTEVARKGKVCHDRASQKGKPRRCTRVHGVVGAVQKEMGFWIGARGEKLLDIVLSSRRASGDGG
jgi:hypothetical protein